MTQNLDMRFSTQNVWLTANTDAFIAHSNGNVKTNAFVNFNTASGFLGSSAVDQKFRFFQIRLQIINASPAENDYILDSLNYTVDLKDKIFRKRSLVTATNIAFDYSETGYSTNPNIVASISNTATGVLAVISNIATNGAHVNCYFASNGAAVTNKNHPGKNPVGQIPIVTLEATGI